MTSHFTKAVYLVSIGAFVYAVVQSVILAKLEPLLLLTTPLSMVSLCLFGALFAIFNVKRYPVQSGLGLLMAVITALMV